MMSQTATHRRRSSLRWAAVAVAAAVAGLIATALSIDSSAAPTAPAAQAPATAERHVPDVAGLHGELASLRAEVRGIRARSAAPAPAPAPETSTSPLPAETDEEAEARSYERTMRQREALDSAFSRSTVDPAWGPRQEGDIRAAFAKVAPPNASLDEVACRGALCRLQLRFESRSTRDRLLGSIATVVPGLSSGFFQLDPDDPLQLVVFASRTPDDFPLAD